MDATMTEDDLKTLRREIDSTFILIVLFVILMCAVTSWSAHRDTVQRITALEERLSK
jgi:uncharacterized membrane protein